MHPGRTLPFALCLLAAPLVLHAQDRDRQTAAVCRDGTRSMISGRGACTGHGGVDAKATEQLRKASKKADKAEDRSERTAAKRERGADKAEEKAERRADKAERKADKGEDRGDAANATARCKDGTFSRAQNRRGACAGHGGVAQWLREPKGR